MASTPTPTPPATAPKPKISFGQVMQFVEHAMVDAEALIGGSAGSQGTSAGAAKRAAVVDLIAMGLEAYAAVEGKAFDVNLATNDLLALLEQGIKTYTDLGLFPIPAVLEGSDPAKK